MMMIVYCNQYSAPGQMLSGVCELLLRDMSCDVTV